MHPEDLAFSRRCASGDPEAVATLVDTYCPFLARVLGRHCGRGEVEDLVAEVLLRLFENGGALLRSYRGEASLRTYLAVIARRTGLDSRRRAGIRGAGRIPLDSLLELAAPCALHASEGDGNTGLQALLDRLSVRDRRVLTLRYLEGLPYRELAKALDAPVGSAAGWVARARIRLRALYMENRTRT